MKKDRKKLVMVNNRFFIGYLFTNILVFISCTNNPKINNDIKEDTTIKKYSTNDTIQKMNFEFYLHEKNISELAKNYYTGKFKPTDNPETDKLLNLSLTTDTTLRPFYFWCLNDIISNADGALMEYVGEPARRYIEEFPVEFLYYIDNRRINVADWQTAINYSGYYGNEQSENAKAVLKNFTTAILKKCTHCNDFQIKRLMQFAQDCFNE